MGEKDYCYPCGEPGLPPCELYGLGEPFADPPYACVSSGTLYAASLYW